MGLRDAKELLHALNVLVPPIAGGGRHGIVLLDGQFAVIVWLTATSWQAFYLNAPGDLDKSVEQIVQEIATLIVDMGHSLPSRGLRLVHDAPKEGA